MIIFDFLIYNLNNWYTAHRSGLQWSNPLERAVYAAGMITMLWLFDFYLIIKTSLLKNDVSKVSEIPFLILFVVLGLSVMQLFQYIYGKKGRLKRLEEATVKPFNISDQFGQALVIGLSFLPIVIFGILLLLT